MNLAARYREWRQPKPSPVTGDMLQPGERITWRVMGVYRRWTTFLALQALTVAWLTWPQRFPGGRLGWNFAWSDLAVVVEMMVGIAFLNQSMRDARIIRAELAELRQDSQMLREIHERIVPRPGDRQ